MALAVGIDLGTTNTVVAAVRDGIAVTLSDAQGERLLPSVVSFQPSGSVLVGRAALERRLADPENTFYSVKRLIGRPFASPEVQQSKGRLPFFLTEGPKGATLVTTRTDTFSLAEISAFVLRQAKAIAEAALGDAVDRAVITVPANFNDLQRAATKTAGRLAGLDVSRILNEPTAAALAYGAQGKQERVAVYDLGGGTFDVTILDLVGNVFEVLATAGDTALGGDDIDAVIADRMADDLIKTQRFDARAAPSGLARLRILGEEMKRELSVRSEHAVVLRDFVPAERGVAVTWRHRMTRPELEWAALPIVERTLKVCEGALAAAGVDAGAIDRVILVGGATRMPMVARKVEQFFGRAPVVSINPDEVVALGAAIQARLLERGGARARTQGAGGLVQSEEPGVAALSAPRAPVEAADVPDLPVVTAAAPALEADRPKGKPPTLPSERNAGTGVQQFLPRAGAKPLVFDTTASVTTPDGGGGRAPPRSHPALSPRAAASKHPNEPAGESRRRPLLIDVTPLSLAVETVGGFCDILIEANTPVPCDRTRSFATASDGQTVVRVRVSQGESRSFADNTFLGEVELSDIAPAPRGQAPIAVTFEIDADGILNVRARDVNTARETAAKMNLVGAQTDPGAMDAMRKRQAAHPLAAPAGR